ncbi:hypothetical protein [Kitasatospora sp. NPDC001527]|uniref:hypothetical protein n=1 Tax=Kitasatospora sp. NPDC001527 TaxID=3154519 RepID=UPI0033251DF8
MTTTDQSARAVTDPVGLITDLITRVEKNLDPAAVRAVVLGVVGGRAKSRRLAEALEAQPEVLTDGRSPALRAIGDLLIALRKAGAVTTSPPVCRDCGKHLRTFQRWRTTRASFDGQEHRIDYQRRRTVLEDWSIPPAHWAHLTDGLPTLDAAPELRICASVLVWTQVTEGDYLFSPLVRDRGWGGRLPGGPDLVRDLPRLAGARRGAKARLLPRLAAYTQQTAAWCDGGARTGEQRTTP